MLTRTPPAWVRSYIGIEFKDKGRDRRGVDCWGLVCLAYAEQFGILLPRMDDLYVSTARGGDFSQLDQAVQHHRSGDGSWKPLHYSEPSVGDIALFVHPSGDRPPHVGLVVSQTQMVHAIAGSESCLEDIASPTRAKTFVDYFAYSGPVLVQGRPNPLDGEVINAGVVAGGTIEEILQATGIEPHPHLSVYLNDRLVQQEHWRHVRPRAGRHLRVVATPLGLGGGGGKNPFRTIAMIAVLVAAVAAPYAAVGLGAAVGTWGAGTLAGSLLAAGVGLVGTLLVNALIPIPKPSIGDYGSGSVAPSIAGTRNSSRIWGVCPVVLGAMRIAPPYAARPYTENVDSDQYLRCLFDVSIGEVEISEPRIGDTALGAYDGVETEYRVGIAGEPPITLYPDTVLEDGMSVLLLASEGWTERTTPNDIEEISVDFTWPTGLAIYQDDGNRGETSVTVAIEYRPDGSGIWTALPNETVTGADTDQIRKTVRISGLAKGRYNVRVKRVTGDASSDKTIDKVYLTAIRTIRSADPVKLTNRARIALRIKASGQLNGVVDQFNVLVKSKVMDYDYTTGTWIKRVTSNPASLYRSVLQGRGGRINLADSRLDLTKLEEWHDDCRINGWEFNGVIDNKSTIFEVIQQIAAAGRATFGMRNGLFSIVRDKRQTVPIQHFTPRNSFGFRGSKAFSDLPHGVRVQFMDQDDSFNPAERIVLDDGYQLDGKDAWGNDAPTLPPALRIEPLPLTGVTSPTQAFKAARYYMAAARLRPEVYQLSTDIEHLVANRGDLVLATHDVTMWGDGAGRIQGLVIDSAGRLTGVTVDESVVMEIQHTYRLRVRLNTGETWYRDLAPAAGEFRQLTFSQPVPSDQAFPAPGDLAMWGQIEKETRELVIKGIEMDKDLGATITLVDHSPQIHHADSGTVPPWDPGISNPPEYANRPETPVIISIRSDDLVMIRGADGSLAPRMLIELRRPASRRPIPVAVQVRIRRKPGAGQTSSWRTLPLLPLQDNTFSIVDVEEGVTYEMEIRTATAAGLLSGKATAEHTVIGKTRPPGDPTSIDVIRQSDGSRRYTFFMQDQPPDLAGFVLRYGAVGSSWNNMLPLHTGLVQASPTELNEPPAGTWRFAIKSVDTSGNESLGFAWCEKTLGPQRLEGVAFSEDAGLMGWPGTKSACHIAGDVLEANDATTWDYLIANALTWETWLRWNLAPSSPIAYTHTFDAGVVLDFSPDAVLECDGASLIEVCTSTDGVTFSSYQDLAIARTTTLTGRYIRVRATVSTSTGFPVPVIRRLLVIMRAAPVELQREDLDTSTLGTSIVATGDVFIPVPAGMFRLIRTVSLTFNGMGAGWSWDLVEKNVSTGPRIRIYNAERALSHATVDVIIRGV